MTVDRVFVFVMLVACGDNNRAGLLSFEPCGNEPFECATLTVPADWSEPSGKTIELLVMRAPARDPANRIGVLTFNFGGPGAQTLAPLAKQYPANPINTAIDLTQRFDWILMDWRGVATTTPTLACLDGTTMGSVAYNTYDPTTDDAWTQLFALTDQVAAGCTANASNAPILANEDTESAARDFDALRAGLGEDTLNMWVVSYGTRLGAMYASLFPDHVRALALDSPMPPVPEYKSIVEGQNASFEVELGRFFAWCSTTNTDLCPFKTSGATPDALAAKYEEMLVTADATPTVVDGITIDHAVINLVATSRMYFPTFDWPQFGGELADLATGNVFTIYQAYIDGPAESGTDPGGFSAYENVWRQDMPLSADIATHAGYQAWAESLDASAPHVGLQNAGALAFTVDWPTNTPNQHVIGASDSPPLLITASRYDPATPYPLATELQQTLANGSYLVTYDGDGHANAQFHRCLGDLAANFLIDPTTPPAMTDCAVDVIDQLSTARSFSRMRTR